MYQIVRLNMFIKPKHRSFDVVYLGFVFVFRSFYREQKMKISVSLNLKEIIIFLWDLYLFFVWLMVISNVKEKKSVKNENYLLIIRTKFHLRC